MFRAFSFDVEGRDAEVDPDRIDLRNTDTRQLLWLLGSAEDPLPAAFDAVEADVAGLVRDRQLCWSSNGEVISFAVPTMDRTRGGEQQVLRFILGPGWLITVADSLPAIFDTYLNEDLGESHKGDLSPAALAYGLLMIHLSELHAVASDINKHIDTL